jgi:Dolichyl-phosphate-mannose-protein mannosyltransferase
VVAADVNELERDGATGGGTADPAPAPPDRRWWASLLAIALVGLGVRLVYITLHDYDPSLTDAHWYLTAANLLADGHGFIDPLTYSIDGTSVQGALHPPGYTVVMAIPSVFGATGLVAHQIWSALIGTATVVVTALVARHVGGPRTGLLAAVIAAVYPWFWLHDATLMSENLAMLLAATILLLGYRFRDAPTARRAAALGVACGLAALTRAEAVLLLVFLAVPLAWVAGGAWRARLGWYATIVGVAGATMVPWVAYNLSRFEEPVFVAVGDNTLLIGNCSTVYEGRFIGSWSFDCVTEANCADRPRDDDRPCIRPPGSGTDESELGRQLRRVAFHNMRENVGRMPAVVLAREGRTWSLFRTSDQIEFDAYVTQFDRNVLRWALAGYYAVAAAFIGGLVVLRRRGTPIFPLLAFVWSVAVAVALVFGETRYRAVAEVPLVIGAAVGLGALWDAAASRLSLRTGPRPPGPDRRPRPGPRPGSEPRP